MTDKNGSGARKTEVIRSTNLIDLEESKNENGEKNNQI